MSSEAPLVEKLISNVDDSDVHTVRICTRKLAEY